MTINPTSRVNVLGVGISILNLSAAVEKVFSFFTETPTFGYVTVTGVHGVTESLSDRALQKIHNQSFLSTPDGMPTVWIGRLKGNWQMGRVYGPDLMLKITAQGLPSNHKHFYFGGNSGVVDELKNCLTKKFPPLNVVGTNTPPFRPLTESEELELLEQIIETKPHFFWVGLSTPKQEKFMHAFLNKYENTLKEKMPHGMLMLGVGAAFDFHAGKIKQAPQWMQDNGFEWLFRTLCEPKRLFMRYLKGNTTFLWNLFLSATGLKQYPIIK